MKKEMTLSQARIGLLSHVSAEVLGGGIGRFIQHLKRALPQLEIFPKPDWPENNFWTRKKINPWYLNWLKNDCVYGRRLKKEHRQRPFDLLFTHSCTGIFLNSKNLNIPVVHLYFGCLKEFVRQTVLSRWDCFVQETIAGRMDRKAGKNKYCTVLSSKVQEEIKEIYGQESHVIRVGVDLEVAKNYECSQARVKLGVPASAKIGLYVGRLEYAKGLDILLKSADLLPDVQFVCVTGEDGSSSMPANLKIQKNISEEKQNCWYAAADFFIIPSRYESASYVTLEAMSFNLPVVISERIGVTIFGKNPALGPKDGVYIAGEDQFLPAIKNCLERKQAPLTRLFVEKNHSLPQFFENYQNLVSRLLRE